MTSNTSDKDSIGVNDCQAKVADYVSKITAAWNRSREAIFECGDYLRQAKQDLPHGEYLKMVENDLPFSSTTAASLRKIAEFRPFRDPKVMPRLPVSWGTLLELEKLGDKAFSDLLKLGLVHSDMTRVEAKEQVAKHRPAAALRALNDLPVFSDPDSCNVGDLASLGELNSRFSVIYADPPWDYYSGDNSVNGAQYPTMKLPDIKRLPVKQNIAAKNAQLFLWVTSPLLDKGLEVMREWGFTYKASFAWVKPNRAISLGWYWANSHELLLLGVRGNGVKFRETVKSHLIADADDVHSRKPDEVRDMIEKVGLEGPRIELFARRRYPGWISWGNEIQRDDFRSEVDSVASPVMSEPANQDSPDLDEAA